MAKGFCPSEDPEWRHDHVDQGLVGHCQRRGCRATWPVFCHSGHRKYCSTCARAVRRERDRAGKARIRKQVQRNADVYRAHLAVHLARSAQQTLDELAGLAPEELDALKALALAMDEDELDEDELDDSPAANIERGLAELALAEQIARLERARDNARSAGDAHGVRVATEGLNALRPTRRLSA